MFFIFAFKKYVIININIKNIRKNKENKKMANQTKGFCKYCGKEYTKGGMLRHLPACKARKAVLEAENGKTKCGYFQIVLMGKYTKAYWLIIEISENATLRELDQFIRDIWVECCGHLSSFDIDGVLYDVMPSEDSFWGPPAKSMNYKLKDVLTPGQTISYEYDFGSTTELILTVHSYRVGGRRKEKITILSRNNPLRIVCSQCGKNEAEWIDPEAYYDEKPFWCEECLRGYEGAEEDDDEDWEVEIPEFWLPVCNSPRMGVCGYEGSQKYPDQFQPDVQQSK